VVTNADWRETDWQAIATELDAQGCARTPRLLAPAQCRDLAALYDKPELFRSTIDLLVIARDWAGRPSRPAPWPDTLAAWVEMCHRAGQGKSAQILLRYQAGTGTRCTVASSATWFSRCRSWSAWTSTARTTACPRPGLPRRLNPA
jgi:hypothetical protein